MIESLTKPKLPGCELIDANDDDDELDRAKTRRDSMNETLYLCRVDDNQPAQRRLSPDNYDSNNKAFNIAPPNLNSIQLTLIISIVSCTFIIPAASTVVQRPSDGKATIVPGQPLHFECKMVDNKYADFIWYYRPPNGTDSDEKKIEPNNDDLIEIPNTRLTLHKPTSQSAGDYICRALNSDNSHNASEFAIISARVQPYIEEFNIEKSHTGKSAVVTDGDRLELICTVADKTLPVNITWLRSTTPDDDRAMKALPVIDANSTDSYTNQGRVLSSMSDTQFDQFDTTGTYTAPGDIIVEALSSHSKRLLIESVKLEHRSYYACVADNGVSSQRMIFIRVKDRMVALWPFLGIVAELFILFTIIYVWETQRAYKTMQSGGSGNSTKASPSPTASNKRPASGAAGAMESVPLTSG